MDRGILVIFAIGAAFIYFAVNMTNISSSPEDSKWAGVNEKAPYAQYYKQDVLGDDVLDFSSVPLAKAKAIWPTTPTKERIVSKLPNFDLAKAEAGNAISDGAFKQYLLKYLDELEGKYLGGEISADQAKEKLSTLK